MVKLSGGLAAASKIEAQRRGIDPLSKNLSTGTKYRMFIKKLGTDDIALGNTIGRDLDRDAFGSSFLNYGDGEIDIREDGSYADVTSVTSLCRIANVLYKAQAKAEKDRAERNIRADAERLGEPVNESELKEAMDKIDLEYFGGKRGDQNIPPKKRPVISGMRTPHIMEMFVVPLTVEGAPEWEKGFHANLNVRSNKVAQLKSILSNRDYNDPASEYLEVGYDYIGKDKQEAGRNASFYGIADSLKLEHKFPESWAKFSSELSVLTSDVDVILSRSQQSRFSCSVNEVVLKFKAWAQSQRSCLIDIDWDADETKRAAKDMLTLDVVKKTPAVLDRLNKIVEATSESTEAETAAEDSKEIKEAQDLAGAKTLQELSEMKGIDEHAGIVGDLESL